MITAVLRAVIRWRALVWLLVTAGALSSAYAIRTASLDAIPDISDPQIIVYVKWARSPQLLETEVTGTARLRAGRLPGIRAIRGSRTWGTRSSTW
jgi:Cu(I)/Ag(I) efflux system membrane protein CusA/SilA